MLSENEIVERIKQLQEQLKLCEELYAMGIYVIETVY